MNIIDIVNAALSERGMTKTALGDRMGITRATMSQTLGGKQRDLTCGRAAKMLEACGYRLVAVPYGARLPKGAMEVEPEYEKLGTN